MLKHNLGQNINATNDLMQLWKYNSQNVHGYAIWLFQIWTKQFQHKCSESRKSYQLSKTSRQKKYRKPAYLKLNK